ncbi:amino acid/amide ABC transporter substrate-binding protein, HAAT family [Noviherbaspirillum humi]|uniref:Amino acid/amide ABC transporter substrate-binding protein, HAAT family n=1 Tax=Noviherbaspirillum humi TaxID=1688639 RepID=A0A239JUS5_9BURK|nr:ABC transporter substrate-binding protein [Noviherbaspirillum humi]SNT09580.1 amino acid/amide ABC transporter substrate-binding protein, HAAT family [Noviherbaspirillum humi]
MKSSNNKRWKFAILGLALAAALPASAQMKIGHIGSMSGPLGALGLDQYDGFMLKVEQGGGMLGGQKVEVTRVDDQGKPDVGLQVAKELLERGKVSVVVGITASNVINAVFPYVVKEEVPLVGTNGGPSPFAGEKCSPWFVSTAFQNDGPHEAAGQEAQNRGFKKVVVITPNYQAGKDAVAGFKRFYKGQLADEVYPALGQSDFAAEITQLAAAAPDAVYAFLPGAMGINFIKQYSQAGLMKKYPLLSSFTVDDITIPAIRDAAVDSLVSSHWTSGATNPESQKFVKEFEAKYKRKPSNYAVQGYDAAALIDQALKSSPAAAKDKKELMKAMRAAKLASPRGELTFERNGFPIQDYGIWKVVGKGAGNVGLELQNVALKSHRDAYVAKCVPKQ